MGMFLFILACIAFLIAGIALAAAVLASRDRVGYAGTAAVALIVGLLFTALASVTVVGPKNVGVITTFGKVSDRTLDSGLHWKKPWQSVTDMDGTIQTTKFVGEDGCIGVRIADGQTACVSVVQRTQVFTDSADELFADYRGVDDKTDGDINDAILDALVRTQLTSALGSVFAGFNPLLEAGVTDPATSGVAPDLQELSDEVVGALNDRLAQASPNGEPQVRVVQVTLSFIRFSAGTQAKIDQLQQEVAATRVAEQKRLTNVKIAAANKALADSLSRDPNVLVSKCLDLIAEGAKLPGGFQCWDGAAAPQNVVPVP